MLRRLLGFGALLGGGRGRLALLGVGHSDDAALSVFGLVFGLCWFCGLLG